MVTGKKTFAGASQASLIAAILDRDPPADVDGAADDAAPAGARRQEVSGEEPRPAAGRPLEIFGTSSHGLPTAQLRRGTTVVRACRAKRLVLIWAVASTALLAGALMFVARPLSVAVESGRDAIRRRDTQIAESPLRHDLAGRTLDWFPGIHAIACHGSLRSAHESTNAEQLAGKRGRCAVLVSGQPLHRVFCRRENQENCRGRWSRAEHLQRGRI